MEYFNYQEDILCAEKIALPIIAQQWDTPTYIYSRSTLLERWQRFAVALKHIPHHISYAVKANANLAVLNTLAQLGSGFDIVSDGELARVIAASGNNSKVIFSGVHKQDDAIRRALQSDILCFNVESEYELLQINRIAQTLNKQAPIALRVNPDINANTHPYIATGLAENKFGIASAQALALYQQAASMVHLKIVGIACHIGSQIISLDPFLETLDHLLRLVDILKQKNIAIKYLNLGGGLGICYHNERPPEIEDYCTAIVAKLANYPQLTLILEPGRSIAAKAGVLLTRVQYIKKTSHKNFAVVDTAMNDLLRPALYQAWHSILPVKLQTHAKEDNYDVVGPICESSDFLAKDRQLKIQTGDLLAIMDVGAYGFTLSSNYNARPRVAEIMVSGEQMHLIRKRETVDELFANEFIINYASFQH